MAKGNMGNFLQHFMGVTAASRLSERGPFDYVDPFAMAPWEALENGSDAQFVARFHQLASGSQDVVTGAFLAALRSKFPGDLPRQRAEIRYPNTVALLLAAGIVPQHVLFCERDEDKRNQMVELLRRARVEHEAHEDAHGTWRRSCSIATMVMLDPDKIRRDRSREEVRRIKVGEIRGLLGRLEILNRPAETDGAPCIITAFSFGNAGGDAHEVDRNLREEFDKRGWKLHGVRAERADPYDATRRVFDQGWWLASHECVEPRGSLTAAWTEWASLTGLTP